MRMIGAVTASQAMAVVEMDMIKPTTFVYIQLSDSPASWPFHLQPN